MNKYIITWYNGSIDGTTKCVYDLKIVDANSIDEVNALDILPKEDRKEVYYTRGLLISDNERIYDYGNYTKFISVKKVND